MSNKLTAGEIAVRLELWRECGYSSQEASKQAGVGRRSFDRFLERYADKDAPISKGVFDQTTIKKIAEYFGIKDCFIENSILTEQEAKDFLESLINKKNNIPNIMKKIEAV